jgi:hypothetical protein
LNGCNSNETHPNEKAKSPEKRLATHLALFYAYGDELFDNDDSLITHFFMVASDELRAEFVSALTPVRIPASLDVKSIEWKRLKSLWQRRYEYIKEQENGDNYRKELAAFLLWVPHIPETLNSFEELIKASAAVADQWQLLNLFEYLAKVVNNYPAFCVSLCEMSLHRGDIQYFFMARREQVKTILQAAIHSGIHDAQESAIRVINLFGERGDESYRDLLKEI